MRYQEIVMKNVTIYSKDYCPYCKAAKHLLRSQGIDYQEIDVQFDREKLAQMIALSKRRTVPQIFFGDEHIGGYDDLVHYYRTKAA